MTNWRQLIMCGAWLSGLFTLPGHASIEEEITLMSPRVEAQYRRAFERTVRLISPMLAREMNSSERDIAADVDIEVTSFAKYDRAFAIREGDDRRIVFDVGLIISMEFILDAGVLLMSGRGTQDDVMDYAQYISERYWSSRDAYLIGKQAPLIEPYLLWLAYTPSEVRRAYRDQAFQNTRVEAKREVIALILAHEFAHHVLGHLKPSRSSEEILVQEEEADEYAMDLASRAGFPLSLAGLGFFYFALIDAEGEEGSRTHPPAECRFARVAARSYANLFADPDFVHHIRSQGTYRQLSAMRAESKQLVNEVCDY